MNFLKNISFLNTRSRRWLIADFGRAVLKIACVASSGEGVKWLAFDAREMPAAAKYEEAAVDFIKGFLRGVKGTAKDIHLVLSHAETVILRSVTLPLLPKQEVLEALRWQLGEEAPFDAAEATLDWQALREYTDEEGVRKMDVFGVMAQTDFIDVSLRAASLCGLNPVGVTLGAFHFNRLIPKQEGASGVSAVLDCGFGDATLSIYRGDRLLFARRLAFSSQKLTQALVGAFISDKTRVEIAADDAERVKRVYGIPEESAGLLEGHLEASEIFSLMRPHLEELGRELKLSFDYFTANIDEAAPAVLYLTGGGARLKNLKGFLRRVISLPVEDLALPPSVDVSALDSSAPAAWAPQVTALAGAGFGRAALDLLPQKLKVEKLEVMEEISLELIGFVVAVIFLVSFIFSRVQIHDYQKRLHQMREQLVVAEQIRALTETIAPRQDLIRRIQKDRVPADGLLKLIGHLIPKAMTLDEFFLDQGERALLLRGKVKGLETAATESVLTGFMRALEASSFFGEAALVSSEKLPEGDFFEIRCDMNVV